MTESSIPTGHPLEGWAAQFPAQREMHGGGRMPEGVNRVAGAAAVGGASDTEQEAMRVEAAMVSAERPLSAAVAAVASRAAMG